MQLDLCDIWLVHWHQYAWVCVLCACFLVVLKGPLKRVYIVYLYRNQLYLCLYLSLGLVKFNIEENIPIRDSLRKSPVKLVYTNLRK